MYEFLRNLFASEQPVMQKFNVTDPTAVGEGVRSITLAYTPSTDDSPTSVISLYWTDSKIKVYEKQFRDEMQAQKLFGAMKGDLDEAARLTKEEKTDAAGSLVRSLLKRYDVYTDEIVDPTPGPVTTSNANLKKSAVQNPLVNKTAKVVMQNLFFETPQELMDYQNKMKGKTTGKPEAKPLGDFKDDLPPLDKGMDELTPEESEDGLAPGSLSYDDYEKEQADEQKLLTKRIEREVKDQVKSALDRKIASTFDAADDELIDAMRGKGRTWEEIKEYFTKELKYEKDSVAAYVDAMREAETGVPSEKAPNPEKPSAPKPPENLVSPETHDKLVDEVSPTDAPKDEPEEHEIEKQDMALAEIARQDTEIKKVAEEPLETIPKPHPGAGQDWEFLPKSNDTSDDLKDDPAMTQEEGDESDPVFAESVKPGDSVYVMADYEHGEEGYHGTIVSVYKQQGDEWAVIDAGHNDLKEVPMRMVKKAAFGGLVNFLKVRKQARLKVKAEFAQAKASAELSRITAEIKALNETLSKEAKFESMVAKLSKTAVAVQRGDAYVIRWLDDYDLDSDDRVRKITRSDLNIDQKYDAVAKLIPEILQNKSDDEDVKIKQADWSEPEINSSQLMKYIEGEQEMWDIEQEEKGLKPRESSLKEATPEGLNGYIGYWRGKQFETYAKTSYEAQQKMAKEHGVKKAHEITVVLAEKGGEPVVHNPQDVVGGQKEAAPGDKPKAPVDPKAPVVEPVKMDVHKKAPPGAREEAPVPASPEVTTAYNEVRDVLHKIEMIERHTQEMLAKVAGQIKDYEEQSGKGALIAQQKAALEKLFSVITPLKAKVVEVEDGLLQVTHEKDKEVKDWTTAKQLKMVLEKFPEAVKYLENALNGLQSGAREVEKRRMVLFPKSKLSRFDKTAGLEEILQDVWDSLKAAYAAVSAAVPQAPAPEAA